MVVSKVNHLENILSETFHENIKVLQEKYSLLTAPGEHYGSVMLAVETFLQHEDGKQEKLNLVAKLLPANDLLRLAFDIYVTFKKEVVAYMQTVPALLRFQQEYNLPEEEYIDRLFPKCYGARLNLKEGSDVVDEDAVIVFENLKLKGYKTEDRLTGFDLEGAKLVVRDLAVFHATPLALKLLRPLEFEKNVRPCLVQNKGLEQLPEEVGQAFHDVIMETAKTIDEVVPYLSHLQRLVDYYAVHPFVERPLPNEPWGTIQHGDYWTSNTMLLRDQNGKPINNKMVDLQLMIYGSAPRDLVFFLFTSVINSVLDEHFDELVKVYYNSFISTIKNFKLDLSPFSWEAFQKELNEIGANEIYHVLVMLKPICTEKNKIVHSAEEFVPSDWSRRDLLGSNHKRKLKDTILAFAKQNWLQSW